MGRTRTATRTEAISCAAVVRTVEPLPVLKTANRLTANKLTANRLAAGERKKEKVTEIREKGVHEASTRRKARVRAGAWAALGGKNGIITPR